MFKESKGGQVSDKYKIENFGKNLKEVIDFLELNQAEFAEAVGITQSAVSQILSGTRAPSIETLVKILNYVPVSFERLLK